MIAHAIPAVEDAAREEWFTGRDERRRQQEEEAVKQEKRRQEVIELTRRQEEKESRHEETRTSRFDIVGTVGGTPPESKDKSNSKSNGWGR